MTATVQLVKPRPVALPTRADIDALEKVMGNALNELELFNSRLRSFAKTLDDACPIGTDHQRACGVPDYEMIGRLWACLSGLADIDVETMRIEASDGMRHLGSLLAARRDLDFEASRP